MQHTYNDTIRNTDLNSLYSTLKSFNDRSRDYVVDADEVKMDHGDMVIVGGARTRHIRDELEGLEGIVLPEASEDELLRFTPNSTAHQQIASRLGIHGVYYRRMLEDGDAELLDRNVNHWLNQSSDSFLLRTIEAEEPGEAHMLRAFLSSNYRRLDNLDALVAVLKAVKEAGLGDDVKVESCDLTPDNMYVRITAPTIRANARDLLRSNGERGSGVITGLSIRNSEVGRGAFEIAPRIVVLACSNGMIRQEDRFYQTHVGGNNPKGVSLMSERTHRLHQKLVLSQARDAVEQFLSPEYVGEVIDDVSELGRHELDHATAAGKRIADDLGLTQDEHEEVMDYFTSQEDNTANGLVQAVTFHAHEVDDPEKQYDLERMAFKMYERIQRFDRPLKEEETV